MSRPHASKDTTLRAVAAVGATEKAPTGRVLSERRRAAGRVASVCLRAVSSVRSLGAIARDLGVSSSAVEHWADPEHDAALTLRDVLAMGDSAAEAVLVTALAHVQARRLERSEKLSPVARVLQLVTTTAGLTARGAAACGDGAIDDGERRELLTMLDEVDRATSATRRDLT